jgi:hypothetical protein
MAGRGRTTQQKRQKEQTRLERRQQKAARKEARKAEKPESSGGPEIDYQWQRVYVHEES